MFEATSPPLPRRDLRWAVAASVVVHLGATYGLLMSPEETPPLLPEPPVLTYFEIASSASGPPAPSPSRSNSGPTPPALLLPDLHFDISLPATDEATTPSLVMQELNLSTFADGLPTVAATGPRTALPLLLNYAETEMKLRERVESLQIATDTVTLNLLIDEQGQVKATEIAKSSGSERFDRIATEVVVTTGKFLPALRGGVPLAVWVGFPVSVEQVALTP